MALPRIVCVEEPKNERSCQIVQPAATPPCGAILLFNVNDPRETRMVLFNHY